MKYNCGHWPDKKKRLESWHQWFAWYPVKIAPYDCRWLETIYRKGVLNDCWDGDWWVWEYRLEEIVFKK